MGSASLKYDIVEDDYDFKRGVMSPIYIMEPIIYTWADIYQVMVAISLKGGQKLEREGHK